MTLALSILVHALLGVVLAAVIWLTGVTIALRLPGKQLANAYAAGLLIVVAAAFVALLSGLLLPVSLVAIVLLAWRGARAAGAEVHARAGRALAHARTSLRADDVRGFFCAVSGRMPRMAKPVAGRSRSSAGSSWMRAWSSVP